MFLHQAEQFCVGDPERSLPEHPGESGIPPLLPGEIHIWPLSLASGQPAAERLLKRCRDNLDAVEMARAERLAHPAARRAFILTRGYLRELLGHYSGLSPPAIRFTYNPLGKPRLAESSEDQGLVFNVSHSGELAVLAFGQDLPLGLDVEQLRPRRRLERLAAYCLAASEFALWQTAAAEQRLAQFTRYWTAKEAFVKATGQGIAAGLDQVVIAEDFLGFAAVPSGDEPATDWLLHSWAWDAYCFALVYRKPLRQLRFMSAEWITLPI